MADVLIVIPARYASTRLPGKPLIPIAGIEMLKRVAQIADYVSRKLAHCEYVVATDHPDIEAFCVQESIPSVMTSEQCQSGTERCWDAVQTLKAKGNAPKFIVNLQGDNPLCPPWFLERLILDWQAQQKTDSSNNSASSSQVFTPFVHLSWDELDALREAKKVTPYSGTTVQIDKQNYALTFSKIILPAMRKEDKLREQLDKPPVRRHIGLYAYTYDALEQYFNLDAGQYEEPEGLEQMRFLEHGIPVKMVLVDYQGRKGMSGVDSPEDIARAEAVIAECGEFDLG
ncbi:3-deoxy-manno-octulosonate cytidylyltransferase family protein [Alteromonas sp. a30]|uniref:3-deoxy-manno-octulosonate cytidylyltransferase family protein n=1 Tax=Alteromonas sp. a30 TaxID=2730917 RepID=UPI00227DC1D3|nr:manno-octulosonate cytidylyltransferase [Alteromonas sp. a30]MCY7296695.1 3-deoxy-manno-octulosonate cytidylyltransferase [Alteromonas sp. a30]